MKSAIAIRHVHFEDLGVLEPFLAEQGYGVHYLDAGVDDLRAVDAASPDLVVVLGAPIGAGDDETYPFLTHELALVRQRLHVRRPLLGICLGAQLIARALGGEVRPMGVKEIGFAPLTLTPEGKASPLAVLDATPVLHWHGDQLSTPPGGVRLAYTEVCASQAFAHGPAVLGLQFHLEVDPAKIERWLLGHACELAQACIDPKEIRRQTQKVGPALSATASKVIGQWLATFDHDSQAF
jgi:GMP synthase (glutamine-hydrolysing)